MTWEPQYLGLSHCEPCSPRSPSPPPPTHTHQRPPWAKWRRSRDSPSKLCQPPEAPGTKNQSLAWPPVTPATSMSDGELLAQLVWRFGGMPMAGGGGHVSMGSWKAPRSIASNGTCQPPKLHVNSMSYRHLDNT